VCFDWLYFYFGYGGLSVSLSCLRACPSKVQETNEKGMVSKVAVLLTVLVAVGAVQKKGFAKKVDQLSPGIT
jgi:hypothetical protein